jgi:hypothetical protein
VGGCRLIVVGALSVRKAYAVGMGDGSVRFVTSKVHAATL